MHEKIVELAALTDYKWHDRQNRVIFTTKEKQSRRVYMFRINSRDGMARVYINDLVINTPVSRKFIEMTDNHIEHDRQQYSTGFYHTCDYSFVSFQLCLAAVKKKLLC